MKRTVSCCLVLVLLISSMCLPASALSSVNNFCQSEEEVSGTKVCLYQNALDIPEDIILDIVSSNPEAGQINIYDWGHVEDDGSQGVAERNLDSSSSIDSLTYYVLRTEKTVTNRKAVGKEEFKFSVAKGESVTLTQEFSGALTGSYSGSPYKGSLLGVGITVTGKFTVGTTYSGPAESSPYNSRQFWLRFYEERGNYTQYKDYYNAADSKFLYTTSTSGTYKKPTTWVSYSVDSKI